MLSKINISIALIIALHAVGVIAILFGLSEDILSLTPLNLMVTAFLIAINDPRLGRSWVFLLTYVIGFAVEMLGVNTGFPFGSYSYGAVLGFKWLETPLLIGLNWLILLYATNAIASKIKYSAFIKALFSAGLMVFLDFLIEPVAIAYDFWSWTDVIPPFENYVAWFVIAFLLSLIWQLSKLDLNKRIGFVVYVVELLFFGALFLVRL